MFLETNSNFRITCANSSLWGAQFLDFGGVGSHLLSEGLLMCASLNQKLRMALCVALTVHPHSSPVGRAVAGTCMLGFDISFSSLSFRKLPVFVCVFYRVCNVQTFYPCSRPFLILNSVFWKAKYILFIFYFIIISPEYSHYFLSRFMLLGPSKRKFHTGPFHSVFFLLCFLLSIIHISHW